MTGQELADAEAAGGRKRLSGQRGLGRRGDSEGGARGAGALKGWNGAVQR
jgi:hypothetical protein